MPYHLFIPLDKNRYIKYYIYRLANLQFPKIYFCFVILDIPKEIDSSNTNVTFEEHQKEDVSKSTFYTDIEEREDVPSTDNIVVDDKEHLFAHDNSLIQVFHYVL